jgi:diaminopimelate epimerase
LIHRHLIAETDQIRSAQRLCDRHRGVGADGLILYERTDTGGTMQLLNADGSRSELSGNGLRCLAALLVQRGASDALSILTDAGPKMLHLEGREPSGRWTFRAAMGRPESIRRDDLTVAGELVDVVTMRIGNPQCVVLGTPLDVQRLQRLGPALEHHPRFPEGTNVELAVVVDPSSVEMLIWERGVGPTEASGTGACASAVAAIAFAGARREIDVTSPGGTQRVEWRDEELFLTGWAEILFEATWLLPV